MLACELNDDGEIDIYPSKDAPPPGNLPKSNRKSRGKLQSLSTPNGIISFDIAQHTNTIVALDKEGSLHKFELQNRCGLREIDFS